MSTENAAGRGANTVTAQFLHGLVPVADDLFALVEASLSIGSEVEAHGPVCGLTHWAEALEQRALHAARQLIRLTSQLGFELGTEVWRIRDQQRELDNLLAELDDPNNDIELDWDSALIELSKEGTDDE